MKNTLKKIWTGDYQFNEWVCMKIPFVAVWYFLVAKVLISTRELANPSGICTVIDCSFLVNPVYKYVILIITLIPAAWYIAERKMLLATSLLMVFSILIFSVEESNGLLSRSSLFSFIFLAQFFAYLQAKLKNENNAYLLAIPFSIQAVAAAYTLSGISKLLHSGIQWMFSGKYMQLQVLKSYYSKYANDLDPAFLNQANQAVSFVQAYPQILTTLLGVVLLLELFAWIAVINKKTAFLYGLLLLCMHAGMLGLLHIFLFSLAFPMIVFMLNPVFVITNFLRRRNRIIYG